MTSIVNGTELDDSIPEKIFVPNVNMVLVMGATGTGKSYFVNSLCDTSIAKKGVSLFASTLECLAVPIKIGGTKVILIDTPGFGDPRQTDSQILEKISRLLFAMYHFKVNLKGVIYLHRITDVRFPRSAVKTLDIFKEICGETALKNVVLATTRWKQVKERDGVQREQNLCEHFWKDMLDKGSQMVRYHGDRDSAKGIIAGLIGKSTVVLDLQHELVEQEKPLSQTKAGKLVSEDNTGLREAYERNLTELEIRRRVSQDSERSKERAQVDWQTEMARFETGKLAGAWPEELTYHFGTSAGGVSRSVSSLGSMGLGAQREASIRSSLILTQRYISNYDSFSRWEERPESLTATSGYQAYGNIQQLSMQGNYEKIGVDNGDERNGLEGFADTNRPSWFQKKTKLTGQETKGSKQERKVRQNEDQMTQSHGSIFHNQDDQVASHLGIVTEPEPANESPRGHEEQTDTVDDRPRFRDQSTDDEIISEFKGLKNMIQTWSFDFAANLSISLNHVEKSTLDLFSEVAPDAGPNIEDLETLMSEGKSKRFLIQGWVGLILSKEIFQRFSEGGWPESKGLDFWMGEFNAKAIQTLERAYLSADRKIVPLQYVNDWRAENVGVFHHIESESAKRRPRYNTDGVRFSARKQREITRQMMDVVKPEPDKLESIDTELTKIIRKAVEVSRLLRYQRPCWSIHYPAPSRGLSGRQLMDSETMIEHEFINEEDSGADGNRSSLSSERHSGKIDKVLELFVSPALFKTGNIDGELWEAGPSCLCKAVVTCKELDPSEASGSYSEGKGDGPSFR